MASHKDVKYWNVNLPEEEQTPECPGFLTNVDQWDRAQLAVRDQDYTLLSWQEVEEIVKNNRLEQFKRVPSDLRKYRQYIHNIKSQYGSVMNFILKERVKWSDLTPQGNDFRHPADIRILRNDWPYGIDPKIVHIVVWTKFAFQEDPETGDLTPEARHMIDAFVKQTFHVTENPQHILWFKNWSALKSVHAVEHFHVMLYDPDPDFVLRVTSGDVALTKTSTSDR